MNDDINLQNRIRKDGWGNILTGLGTAKGDKRKSTKSRMNNIVSDSELESIYADDGLGARIVDLLPEDMVKQGWKYCFKSEKEGLEIISEKYEDLFKSAKIKQGVCKAIKWARLYGGSLILIGAFDGQTLDQPLAIKGVKSFESLKVIPRGDVQFGSFEFNTDETSKRFGQVEYYAVNMRIGNSYKILRIHYSRIIEVKGIEIPTTNTNAIPAEYRYFGISVLQRVYERLADLGSSFGSIANLMNEITVGKYKMKDLADIVSSENGDKLVQNRVQVMDLMKSVFHSIIMDSEEDYIRDTISLSGIPEVMYQFMMIISSNTGYPMTRLFGISPGGLNSTGDSDTYTYYDMVKANQENVLLPILDRLLEIISVYLNLEKPSVEFNPLEQMTEKEQAELEERKANTEKVKMETYQGYIDMGIMEPEIVEELEFGDSLKEMKSKIAKLPPVEEITEREEE